MVYHYYDYNRVAVLQILNLNPTNKAFLQTKLREKGSTKKSCQIIEWNEIMFIQSLKLHRVLL